METEHFRKVKRIFQQAMELAGEERDAFLDEACEGDADLRASVESLLRSLDHASDFIETPAYASVIPAADDAKEPWEGKRIGGYRIVRTIGSGGMGTVYEAVQEHPERTVALKVMIPGIASAAALKRFELETRILAALRHPGIAQIYDAGTHGSGSGSMPYFVMEYIPAARTVTEYSASQGLEIRDRLELFCKVCDAVNHGHQRGIIHRDLKPANILVDTSFSTGQPKVIDFGVARAVDPDMALTVTGTGMGQIVGSLQYMSPEQCKIDRDDVDIRSDVYSLGMVLYELLSGRLPYNLSKKSITEKVRIISEAPPIRLSAVEPSLRGDVETITLKALEKDRDRRYSTAADLAKDIRLFLASRPIEARPPSALYQLSLFAGRNRAAVAAGVVILVALVVAVVVSMNYAFRAHREADSAARRLKESEHINAFLQGLLASADPAYSKGKEVTVREVLDNAAARIENEFDDMPAVEASVRATIGQTYKNLGLVDEAEAHLEAALAINKKFLGEKHRDTLESMLKLATLLGSSEARLAEAELLYRQVLEISRGMEGGYPMGIAASLRGLGKILTRLGRYDEAETMFKEVLEDNRGYMDENPLSRYLVMDDLGYLYMLMDRHDEAEALSRKALEGTIREKGREHPDSLGMMQKLGSFYSQIGRAGEAEGILEECLAGIRRVKGEDHPDTLAAMGSLGSAYQEQGRYDEAEPLLEAALEGTRRFWGNNHHNVFVISKKLSELYRKTRRYVEAEHLCREALRDCRRAKGDDHPLTIYLLNQMVDILYSLGRNEEAEPLCLEALKTSREKLGDDRLDTLKAMSTLSYIYFRMKRYVDAEPLAKEVLERRRRKLGDDNESTIFSMFNLGRIYVRSARWADAEPLLNESQARYRRLRGDEDPYLFRSLAYLAPVYANLGRLGEAERLAREAVEMPCAGDIGYKAARSSLVELLDQLAEMKEDGQD